MYDIAMDEPTEEWVGCWAAAGNHLEIRGGSKISWLKCDLRPPFLEHLSFRMGNQLFFVRIEDADRRVPAPGVEQGLRAIALECRGHACRLPMRLRAGSWAPAEPGWGLVDAATQRLIDPVALITDEKLEMTDWEVHDFAIQIVKQYEIDKEGRTLMSSNPNPRVDPSIWFADEEGPAWIVVRAARCPAPYPSPPDNLKEIARSCARGSHRGYFAPMIVAHADQPTDVGPGDHALRLIRGEAMVVAFSGMRPLSEI